MPSSTYHIARKIAAGGMAEVLLATQAGLAGFEKLVVIKRILPNLREDAQFVRMFLDEARLAASLRHQNIVEIYDIQRDEQDFFIVMEYLSGEDLNYILRQFCSAKMFMPVEIACRIVAEVAEGLTVAHTATDLDGRPREIVHRDISPSNIAVTYDGAVKLVDFGVAKANEHNVYTRPGALKGKFGYVSPEQVAHKPIDARADIFALGVVLWELLTNSRLFKADSEAATLKAVMERKIHPPGSRNPAVPPALDKLVLATLRRDRDKRLQTAAELRDGLEDVLGQMPSVTSRDLKAWMRSTFNQRYTQRRHVEREVQLGSRDGAPMDLNGPPEPIFSEPDSGSVSRFDSRLTQPVMMAAPRPRSQSRMMMMLGVLVVVLGGALVGLTLWRGSTPTPAPVAGANSMATLLVRAVPEGATLWVDGKAHGQAVGVDGVLLSVPRGRPVQLRVEKEGYAPQERKVSPGAGVQRVLFSLRRGGPRVVSTTTAVVPATTPDASAAAPTPAPTPDSGATEPPAVAATPDPVPAAPRRRRRPRRRVASMGRIVLVSEPADAILAFDGLSVEGRSPHTIEGVEPGTHHVVLAAAGYRQLRRSVAVQRGQTLRLSFNLEKVAAVKPKPVARPTPKPKAAPRPKPRPTPKPVAAAPVAAPPAKLTVPKGMNGDAGRGRALFRARCATCHAKKGKSVSPRRYTAAQWERFFRRGRHARKTSLRPHFDRKSLAHVKTYLMQNAADRGGRAAGIQ